MKITLKDGSVKEYSEAKSVFDIALDISEGLARMAAAGEVNGEIVDLRTMVDSDCELNIVTVNDAEGLRVLRHTASHVLAEAVKNLFPNAKITIGPAIDEGFYYDFDSDTAFSADVLSKLEDEIVITVVATGFDSGSEADFGSIPAFKATAAPAAPIRSATTAPIEPPVVTSAAKAAPQKGAVDDEDFYVILNDIIKKKGE